MLAVAAVAAGAAPASESPLVVYSNYTLSVARQYLAATSVSNLALFGGGGASNVVDIFNSVSGLWTTATLSVAVVHNPEVTLKISTTLEKIPPPNRARFETDVAAR